MAEQLPSGRTRRRLSALSADRHQPALGEHKARLGCKADYRHAGRMAGVPSPLGRAVLKKNHATCSPSPPAPAIAYHYADALVAVSADLPRPRQSNPNVPSEVVYIGADFPKLDAAPAKTSATTKPASSAWVRSVTAMTWKPCAGVRKLLDGGENVELHIMGGGPDLDGLKQYACEGIKFTDLHPLRRNDVGRQRLRHLRQRHPFLRHTVDANKLSDYMALPKLDFKQLGQWRSCQGVLTLLPRMRTTRSGDVDSFVQAAKTFLAQKRPPFNPAKSSAASSATWPYQKSST